MYVDVPVTNTLTGVLTVLVVVLRVVVPVVKESVDCLLGNVKLKDMVVVKVGICHPDADVVLVDVKEPSFVSVGSTTSGTVGEV